MLYLLSLMPGVINFRDGKFQDYPLFIQGSLVIITICLVATLAVIISLALNRYLNYKQGKEVKEARDEVTEALTEEVMLNEQLDPKKGNSFRRVVRLFRSMIRKSPVYRQVLVDEIIFFNRNFTDRASNILVSLYNRLQLRELSLKKLRSRNWWKKAKGLRELQYMEQNQGIPQIHDLLNEKNDDLRIEAQLAYLKNDQENPFAFLDNASEELLPWHQILLFEAVTSTEEFSIPTFSKYLRSTNDSVVVFTCKLIVHYHPHETIPELIQLIRHPNHEVRCEVFATLGKLGAEEAEYDLVESFPEQPKVCQISILQALGNIRSGHYIPFLEELFLQADDFDLQKESARALVNHQETLPEELFSSRMLPEEKRSIIKHVREPLIRE